MKRNRKLVFLLVLLLIGISLIISIVYSVKLRNSFSTNKEDDVNENETTLNSTIINATEPQISKELPQTIYPMAYALSDFDVSSTNSKIFFVSNSGTKLYCAYEIDGNWQVNDVGITNVRNIKSYGSSLYILVMDDNGIYRLLLYNIDDEKITYEINLDEKISGDQVRSYSLSCSDETGIYLYGESDKARDGYSTQDYTVFLNVSPIGEVSVLKGFGSNDNVRLVLVKNNIFYYDWKDDGNYGVYSWNKDTDSTIIISKQLSAGNTDNGTTYYIWNNKLVFPLNEKGICIASLDGKSEKIYRFNSDSSFAVLGDYAFFAESRLKKVSLKTGVVTYTDDKSGDYRGTLSLFNNQLILLRYEGTAGDTTYRTIYLLDTN